jgi:hypothetical protein
MSNEFNIDSPSSEEGISFVRMFLIVLACMFVFGAATYIYNEFNSEPESVKDADIKVIWSPYVGYYLPQDVVDDINKHLFGDTNQLNDSIKTADSLRNTTAFNPILIRDYSANSDFWFTHYPEGLKEMKSELKGKKMVIPTYSSPSQRLLEETLKVKK